LFLGVELELENRTSSNLLNTWKTLKDHAIIKRDSSVSNGLEICTAPASISVHKEEFKDFIDMVKNSTLEARSTCGMHVHVDRANLTELQIGKILSFMYNKQNKKLINKIAGRKDNNYCSLEYEKSVTSGVYFDESSDRDYRKKLHRSQSEGRYTGVNLSPAHTIEFRIFASTISYEEFSKNLEFVQSMIDFTKPSAVNVKSLKDFENKEVYLNFVKENRKQYPNLFQFLKEELK
ncbi:MAG: amidoligase family protein, partial [Thaumarchaeota archaeon]|nr:amidoligase family protein [Nitrososphaerota archaeon]